MVLEHVVRPQHEHDHVRPRGRQPPGQVAIRDVDGQVPRVALVAVVPVGVGGGAVLRVVRHGPDEVDPGGRVGVGQVVPELGAPAGDLRDGVAQGHWWARSSVRVGGGEGEEGSTGEALVAFLAY